jgi:hypothetical protein
MDAILHHAITVGDVLLATVIAIIAVPAASVVFLLAILMGKKRN